MAKEKKTTKEKEPTAETHDHRHCLCKGCCQKSEDLMRRVQMRSGARGWYHNVDLSDLKDKYEDDPVELAHKIGERIEQQPWYSYDKELPNGIYDLELFVRLFKNFKAKKSDEKTVESFDAIMDNLWDWGDNLRVFFKFR